MQTLYTLLLTLFLLPTFSSADDVLWQADAGEEKVSLIELYTSQGCHSCPPAEKIVNSLDGSPELWRNFVPLAFHVDYWNYIGWKDPFSDSKYSKRQYYHKSLGNVRSVYTPGWLINGKEWRGYFQRQVIPKLSIPSIPLQAKIENKNYLTISVPYLTKTATPKPAFIYTAILGSDYKHSITSGENNGKTLKSNFVVLKISSHRASSNDHREGAQNHWQIPLPRVKDKHNSSKMALAVWLSDQNLKPIQAAGNWIDKSLVTSN